MNENMCPHKNTCINVHSTLTFNSQKLETTKQLKWPSTDKLWYAHAMEYYSAIKRIRVSYWSVQQHAAPAAKLLQPCPTLCNPIDGSPPGSPVPGILQARTLEWVAISFSNAWKRKVKVKSLNHVQLLATPWTAAHQAPPSMGFSREEYWSGVPFPSPFNNMSDSQNNYVEWKKPDKKSTYWRILFYVKSLEIQTIVTENISSCLK